jgi:hypothetical protein
LFFVVLGVAMAKSDSGGMMDLGPLVAAFIVIGVVCPFGLWKIAEVLFWLWSNVHIGKE